MARTETRVERVAAVLWAERGYVRLVDVLVRLGWLALPNVERWERGLATSLDKCVSVDGDKVATAVAGLHHWAHRRGLSTSELDYGDLQFTAAGDADTERAYRTQWGSVGTDPTQRPRRPRVRAADYALECETCGRAGDLLLGGRAGGLCLDCADLGHLEFLPSGDAALTRRVAKVSSFSAVVMHWNARRNRFERQGILAEPAAIERAAHECLTDAEARISRRQHEQNRRADQDVRFRAEFAAAIREQFPGCPVARAEAIAFHAAARGSGRVGRSTAGRALDAAAVRLALVASVRHVDTDYDALLLSGIDRDSARARVRQRVDDIVTAWRDGVAMLEASDLHP